MSDQYTVAFKQPSELSASDWIFDVLTGRWHVENYTHRHEDTDEISIYVSGGLIPLVVIPSLWIPVMVSGFLPEYAIAAIGESLGDALS
jgi:hypothetical protein